MFSGGVTEVRSEDEQKLIETHSDIPSTHRCLYRSLVTKIVYQSLKYINFLKDGNILTKNSLGNTRDVHTPSQRSSFYRTHTVQVGGRGERVHSRDGYHPLW